MEIGLGTYALAWSIGVPGRMPEKPMNIHEFLTFAHDMGFHLVQIADNVPLHRFHENELKEILGHAKNLNLNIEVGARGMTVENTLNYLKIANIVGSPILRMVIDQNGFAPGMAEIHEIILHLIPYLEKSGIRLAIENHDRLKATQFQEIIEKANSSYVGICLDTVNSIGADEGFETVFNILAPFTFNFHLKDYVIRRKSHMMGFDITGTPAGKGRMDIEMIFQRLTSWEKCGSIILELWPEPESTIEETIKKEKDWVNQSAQFLLKNFRKL